MNHSKFITAEQAASLIQDGWMVVIEGAGRLLLPEAVSSAIERRFLKTGQPRNITLIQACGMGDDADAGVSHFAHAGLVKRVISPGWGDAPRMAQLAAENKVEAYCFPQGIMCQMVWACASNKPRVISHVGLDTFVDPRLEGGKFNALAKEDLVDLIEIDGRSWLAYKVFPFDAAIIRGTTADEAGNISMEHEPVVLETLAMAQAARNSGGIVIAEVKRRVRRGSLHPQMVKVPGMLVDYIVINAEAQQIHGVDYYNPACSGEIKASYKGEDEVELDARMIVARRAALELAPLAVVNVGFGISDGVPVVAMKEDVIERITFTVEQGSIGGIPLRGRALAAQVNPAAIIDQISQFNFYQGGGLDLAFLSFAQVDRTGNVNVSKFGSKLPGCGGFIDISENAKKVIFSATFSSPGDVQIQNGRINVLNKGKYSKFPRQVEQITFNGAKARDRKQPVLYVTERAVFGLVEQGLMLLEIAPGCEVKKDILEHMEFEPLVPDHVKTMEAKIFQPVELGIKQLWD